MVIDTNLYKKKSKYDKNKNKKSIGKYDNKKFVPSNDMRPPLIMIKICLMRNFISRCGV